MAASQWMTGAVSWTDAAIPARKAGPWLSHSGIRDEIAGVQPAQRRWRSGQPPAERCPHDMKTRLIDEPGFAAETSAFLERIGQAAPISDYESLLAARARTASPAVSGQMDPAVQAADLYLPARGGPVLARLYRERGARGPRQILLWLHGGGFIGGPGDDPGHARPGLPPPRGLPVVSAQDR